MFVEGQHSRSWIHSWMFASFLTSSHTQGQCCDFTRPWYCKNVSLPNLISATNLISPYIWSRHNIYYRYIPLPVDRANPPCHILSYIKWINGTKGHQDIICWCWNFHKVVYSTPAFFSAIFFARSASGSLKVSCRLGMSCHCVCCSWHWRRSVLALASQHSTLSWMLTHLMYCLQLVEQ